MGAIATSSTPADLLPQVWVAQRSDQMGYDAGAELPRHIRKRRCQLQEFAWEIKRHYLISRDRAMKNLVILINTRLFSLKSKFKLGAKILDYFFMLFISGGLCSVINCCQHLSHQFAVSCKNVCKGKKKRFTYWGCCRPEHRPSVSAVHEGSVTSAVPRRCSWSWRRQCCTVSPAHPAATPPRSWNTNQFIERCHFEISFNFPLAIFVYS